MDGWKRERPLADAADASSEDLADRRKRSREAPQQVCRFSSLFRLHCSELDRLHDEREACFRAGRQVTIESKRAIFALLRGEPPEDVAQRLREISQRHFGAITSSRFESVVDPAVEEFAEACLLLEFLQSGKLLLFETFASRYFESISFRPRLAQYMLGLGDLAGEVMRYATNLLSHRQESADSPAELSSSSATQRRLEHATGFVRRVERMLALLPASTHPVLPRKLLATTEMALKMESMLYELQLRLAEGRSISLPVQWIMSAAEGTFTNAEQPDS